MTALANKFLSDCSVLQFHNDKNNWSDNTLSSVAVDNSTIMIKEALKKPLYVSCDANTTLTMSVSPNVNAHVVMRMKASAAMQLSLPPYASLNLYVIADDENAINANIKAKIEKNACLKIFDVAVLNDRSERDYHVDLRGQCAEVSYFGLEQIHRDAKKHTNLIIHHHDKETKSEQAIRGVYAGRAQSKFLGKVVVEKGGDFSKARQLYRSIILGDDAKALVKPELEIHNHEISASHGASIGALDDNALFYLCSRGISLVDAKAMLVKGLLDDILDQIEEPVVKALISSYCEASIASLWTPS